MSVGVTRVNGSEHASTRWSALPGGRPPGPRRHGPRLRPLRLRLAKQTREVAAEGGPAPGGADGVAHALPTVAVAIEVAMFELDPGPGPALGLEAHLDLARLRRVGLELPSQW